MCVFFFVFQVCVWQQLQAVRTEISELEQQKKLISESVKALVVSKGYRSKLQSSQ